MVRTNFEDEDDEDDVRKSDSEVSEEEKKPKPKAKPKKAKPEKKPAAKKRKKQDSDDEEEDLADEDDDGGKKGGKGKSVAEKKADPVPLKKRLGAQANAAADADDSNDDEAPDDGYEFDLYKDDEERKRMEDMNEMERELILSERGEARENMMEQWRMRKAERLERKKDGGAKPAAAAAAATAAADKKAAKGRKKPEKKPTKRQARRKGGSDDDDDDDDEYKAGSEEAGSEEGGSEEEEGEAAGSDGSEGSDSGRRSKRHRTRATAGRRGPREKTDKEHALDDLQAAMGRKERRTQRLREMADGDERGRGSESDGAGEEGERQRRRREDGEVRGARSDDDERPSRRRQEEPSSSDDDDDAVAEFKDVEAITVRRDQLEKWHELPIFEETLVGAFARASCPTREGMTRYLLCEVVEVVSGEYGGKKLNNYRFGKKMTDKYLVLKYANNIKPFRMLLVSNTKPVQEEFNRLGEHSASVNLRPPTKSTCEMIKKRLKDADEFKWDHKQVRQMLAAKREAPGGVRNLAMEKRKIVDEMEMCDDPARLAELEAALKEVDDHIKTMFKAEVSMSEINRRNIERNVEDIQIISQKAREAAEGGAGAQKAADPFSRRPTRVVNYFQMGKPSGAAGGDRFEEEENPDKTGAGQGGEAAAEAEGEEPPSPGFAPPPTPKYKGKDFLKQAHDMDLGLDLSSIRSRLRPDGQGLADPSHAFPHLRRGYRYVEFEHTAEAAQRAGRTFLTIADYMKQNPENAPGSGGAAGGGPAAMVM